MYIWCNIYVFIGRRYFFLSYFLQDKWNTQPFNTIAEEYCLKGKRDVNQLMGILLLFPIALLIYQSLGIYERACYVIYPKFHVKIHLFFQNIHIFTRFPF